MWLEEALTPSNLRASARTVASQRGSGRSASCLDIMNGWKFVILLPLPQTLWTRPEGAKALSSGQRPEKRAIINLSLCKSKRDTYWMLLLPLQGVPPIIHLSPWAESRLGFQPATASNQQKTIATARLTCPWCWQTHELVTFACHPLCLCEA